MSQVAAIINREDGSAGGGWGGGMPSRPSKNRGQPRRLHR